MLSKTALHSLAAMKRLAQLPPDQFVGAAEIAKAIGAPPNYLGKVFKLLAENGLLVSQKGFNGGFRLAKNVEDISIYDIVEPIDKVSRWGGCFMSGGECRDGQPCAVHEDWKRLREEYLNFLRRTKLSELTGRSIKV